MVVGILARTGLYGDGNREPCLPDFNSSGDGAFTTSTPARGQPRGFGFFAGLLDATSSASNWLFSDQIRGIASIPKEIV